MRNSKAKKIRKECRVYLEDLKAQDLKTRIQTAWVIIKGTKLNTVKRKV